MIVVRAGRLFFWRDLVGPNLSHWSILVSTPMTLSMVLFHSQPPQHQTIDFHRQRRGESLVLQMKSRLATSLHRALWLLLSWTVVLVAPAARTVVFTAPRNRTVVCSDDKTNVCTASTQCSKNGAWNNKRLPGTVSVVIIPFFLTQTIAPPPLFCFDTR
jgi:hypothetical protein